MFYFSYSLFLIKTYIVLGLVNNNDSGFWTGLCYVLYQKAI